MGIRFPLTVFKLKIELWSLEETYPGVYQIHSIARRLTELLARHLEPQKYFGWKKPFRSSAAVHLH